MKVCVSENNSVMVEYYPMHNHVCRPEDYVHHPLPDKMSRFINKKLAENIPPTAVYEMTKELYLPKKNTPNVNEVKANILTKKRVLERGRRRRMARRLHNDDAKAVYLMVTQMLDGEDASSVLIYKPYGSKVVHGPPEIDQLPNSSDLFMFAMQTERQSDLMKNHCGKIIIVDETHGTNQ
ncbi:Protein HIR1 [Frankliniella fusca]|uniref:Protein HIR1 n=1 Tax=Frankliniella fusca TaxID=407009 RepID=A0AAE1LLP7_9NEOP|nr:Protein HIR1 [Frankliniella fusca]